MRSTGRWGFRPGLSDATSCPLYHVSALNMRNSAKPVRRGRARAPMDRLRSEKQHQHGSTAPARKFRSVGSPPAVWAWAPARTFRSVGSRCDVVPFKFLVRLDSFGDFFFSLERLCRKLNGTIVEGIKGVFFWVILWQHVSTLQSNDLLLPSFCHCYLPNISVTG